jgi:hypothetical protein
MVRTIITPGNTHIELDIPQEYVGKTLEIVYQALDEIEERQPKKTMGDFLGILSDKSANELRKHVKKVRDEWERDF